MKSWADHCSSDEEDFDPTDDVHDDEDDRVPLPQSLEKIEPQAEEQEDNQASSPPSEEKPTKTYNFPTAAPFTAFIGNLAYSLTDPKVLADEISSLVENKLGLEWKVFNGRIMMDRKSEKPRHRGFGYVEVETLDQLKALMELNEMNPTIAGRPIQLDTASMQSNSRPDRARRGNSSGGVGPNAGGNSFAFPDRIKRGATTGSIPPEIDGSKFRGGRDFKRGGGARRASDANAGDSNDSGGPPLQRTSLRLQPRSKPVSEASSSNASSNIFGPGKARDEMSWHERRKSDASNAGPQKRQPSRNNHGNNSNNRGNGADRGDNQNGNKGSAARRNRNSTGRGAGGRGGVGRGPEESGKAVDSSKGGEDGFSSAKTTSKSDTKNKSDDKKKQTHAGPPDADSNKPATKKIVNKFEVLGFDSDSD